MSKKLCKK